MSTYAIVVKIPEPQDFGRNAYWRMCFIATPFAGEFRAVSDVIKDAANKMGMQSVRTDEVQFSDNFVDDITKAIKFAEMVVAVCTPITGTDKPKPNPNVLYELGLAQALGKPTILMTTDIATIPRDVDTQYVLTYTEAELEQRDGLRDRLVIQMTDRRNRMRDPYTDSAYHTRGITVAQARHRMLIDPVFWEHFKLILAFSKRVHEQIQAIAPAHIEKLLRTAGEIASRPAVAKKEIINFNEMWSEYERNYELLTKPSLFTPLDKDRQSVEQCFQNLLSQTTGGTAERIEKCRKNYQIVSERLDSYRQQHDHLTDNYRGDFSDMENAEKAALAYNEVRKFSYITNAILIHADGLIKNLIELIVD